MADLERVEDLLARRQANLHRYSTYTFNQIVRLLERVDSRLTLNMDQRLDGLTEKEKAALLRGNFTTKRLQALREDIRTLANEVRNVTSTVIGNNGKELAQYEIEASERLAAAFGLDGLGAQVSVSQAYAAAMARPMLGVHVRDHVADLSADFRKKLFAEIREGFLSGEGAASLSRRIRGSAAARGQDGLIFRRNKGIETVVRTSMNHIANVAAEESLTAAGAKEYIWISTLDGRTSKICAARDREIYKTGEGPRPPAHPNCRSRIRPYVEGEGGGKRPFVSDKRPVSKIPKKQRTDKIGQVKQTTNYEAWFKRQPASFQKEWLGPTRYKLYKEGVPLKKFSDPRTGREYNLQELRRMDGAAFEEAGL